VKEKNPIERAVEIISQLPGFGEKSATRLVYWLAGEGRAILKELVSRLDQLDKTIKTCSVCGDISFSDPCPLCSNPSRDSSVIMVVEDGKSKRVIEKTGIFKGRYHILGGLVSPKLGITPDKLRINELIERIKSEGTKEIIIGLSSSQEGQATEAVLIDKLSAYPVKITRLARGMPVASAVEYLDQESLRLAIEERKRVR